MKGLVRPIVPTHSIRTQHLILVEAAQPLLLRSGGAEWESELGDGACLQSVPDSSGGLFLDED